MLQVTEYPHHPLPKRSKQRVKNPRIMVTVPDPVYKLMDTKSKAFGITVSELIRNVLTDRYQDELLSILHDKIIKLQSENYTDTT
jgi:hypothetical protein